MSFENKNLYALLGNDVEDDEPAAPLPVKELVKKNTSSKKADAAPASADPAKAKKKSKVTGNEGAYKNKYDNKSVSAPTSTPSKHYKKPLDRQSRSNKSDSQKKVNQGWGNSVEREIEGEVEGAQDAAAELLEEVAEVEEPQIPKKSLQDYFAELELKQQALGGAKPVRKANEGAEGKWTSEEKILKEQEIFFESTVAKKNKSKAQKEKKFLDFDASFADEAPQKRDSAPSTRGRGAARGGARGRGAARGGARGGRSDAPKPSSQKPEINDKNFPSL